MKLSIRSMIVAPPGKRLIAFDLSQAESWIVAYRARERNMKRALKYGDIHTETAGSALFFPYVGCAHEWVKGKEDCQKCGRVVTKIMRYSGKKNNHANGYRQGPSMLAVSFNRESDKPPYVTITVREAKKFYEAWHSYYNVRTWWSEIDEKLARDRTIVTSYGRSRMFFGHLDEHMSKEATAYEPQSVVADHFNGRIHPLVGQRGGLVEIYKQLVKPYREHRIINQSHDSAVLEVPLSVVPDLVPQIQHLMLRPIVINDEDFTIPVDVEVGERLGELEKVA